MTDPEKLLILTPHATDFAALIEAEQLENLQIACAVDQVSAAPHIADATIILGIPTLLRPLLPAARSLKWVQSTWAGITPLVENPPRSDYLLTNVKGIFGAAMSEYVIGYLLMHERLGWARREAQARREWDQRPPGTLRGKRFGVLGVGSIGCYLAATAKQFDMTVLGYSRQSQTCRYIDHYFHGAALEEMLSQCDYLVSVLPDTTAARGLLGHQQFQSMPAGSVFVNVGRGSTVNEEALITALRDGPLAAAILDVFETEPLPVAHPLWELPNVIITSHTAAVTVPRDTAPIFIENYRLFRSGSPLKYLVDFERGY